MAVRPGFNSRDQNRETLRDAGWRDSRESRDVFVRGEYSITLAGDGWTCTKSGEAMRHSRYGERLGEFLDSLE